MTDNDDPDAKLAAYYRQMAERFRHDAAISRREAEMMYASPFLRRECLKAAESWEEATQRLNAKAADYAAAARKAG